MLPDYDNSGAHYATLWPIGITPGPPSGLPLALTLAAFPGRSAARSAALPTPISGLPEIGTQMRASRINPDKSDLRGSFRAPSLGRSRISGAALAPSGARASAASGTPHAADGARCLPRAFY